VLFVAGITLALTFGGGVAALTASAYGGVIAAKAALASSALAVGAWNRLRLVEQLACDVPSARSNVRRAMALDAILFLAIAAATTAATTLFAPEVQ
jgi:putative copper export protein